MFPVKWAKLEQLFPTSNPRQLVCHQYRNGGGSSVGRTRQDRWKWPETADRFPFRGRPDGRSHNPTRDRGSSRMRLTDVHDEADPNRPTQSLCPLGPHYAIMNIEIIGFLFNSFGHSAKKSYTNYEVDNYCWPIPFKINIKKIVLCIPPTECLQRPWGGGGGGGGGGLLLPFGSPCAGWVGGFGVVSWGLSEQWWVSEAVEGLKRIFDLSNRFLPFSFFCFFSLRTVEGNNKAIKCKTR